MGTETIKMFVCRIRICQLIANTKLPLIEHHTYCKPLSYILSGQILTNSGIDISSEMASFKDPPTIKTDIK